MRQLGGPDVFHLMEETGEQPMHTIKVAVLDDGASGSPHIQDVRDWLNARMAALPVLRWQLACVPFGLAKPYWIDGPPPDLSVHVRHARLGVDVPGSFDDFLAELA